MRCEVDECRPLPCAQKVSIHHCRGLTVSWNLNWVLMAATALLRRPST